MTKIILILLISLPLKAATLKVMSFNTMCDFCKGSNFFKYNERIKQIHQTIKKHGPDLVALQEVRTVSQVKQILAGLPQYDYFTTDSMLISYADPTVIYNKHKFKRIGEKQFWLGPKSGDFSLGWKFALPRQLVWVKLKMENYEFIFASSHLDNRIENLRGSSKMLNSIFKKITIPIIFAADTNLTTDMPEYTDLIKNIFVNAFDLKDSLSVQGTYSSDKDICYLRKGKVFPLCRVDHIFFSKKHKWSVSNYIIDAVKEGDDFASDHRPIITTVDF